MPRLIAPAPPSGTYARVAEHREALDFLPLTATSTAIGANPTPRDVLADGYLYGNIGAAIHRSNDDGATWTLVQDPGGSDTIGLRDVGDGEVVRLAGSNIYRSSGWDTDPATATWSLVLTPPVGCSILQWGFDAYDNYVLVADYAVGPRDPSKTAWLSDDYGATFTAVFDLLDFMGAEPASQGHMHGVAIDYFHDPVTPRLWVSAGDIDEDVRGIFYSDDLGANWTKLTGAHQPTVLVATEHGIVCGSDTQPDGVYRILRTDDPADMVVEPIHYLRVNNDGAPASYAYRGFRDEVGAVYIGFNAQVDGGIPAIIATDGLRANEVWRYSGAALTGYGVRDVTATATAVVAYVNEASAQMVVAPKQPRGALPPHVMDPGGVLGGTSGDYRAVAVGTDSSAAGIASTAVGVGASVTVERGVAVGRSSAVTGSGGVAAGREAASGQNAIAVGADSDAVIDGVALGGAAQAVGTGSIAIGRSANGRTQNTITIGKDAVSGSDSVVIGKSATGGATSGGLSVIIGTNATNADTRLRCVVVGMDAASQHSDATCVGHASAAHNEAVAIGRLATATTNGAVAIGKSATASHVDAVAIGRSTVTTVASQVAIGARHFELTELASDPAAPAANNVRLYAKDNGSGKTGLYARFNTGAVQQIALEP